jgi:hypothetical protein
VTAAADHDNGVEPVPGLPEALPAGERVLWSGVPDWKAVAIDVFHIRAIALYALALVAWRIAAAVYDGRTLGETAMSVGILAGVLGLGLGIIAALAYFTATTTRYTITNRRVAMRIGVALTMTVNLPFREIVSADLRAAPFGTGAIALTMKSANKIGYLALWPHARPLHFSNPQPMLRGIKDPEAVAAILGRALVASRGETSTIRVERNRATPRPVAA